MTKHTCLALAFAPVVCMSSYASDDVAAQEALKGAIVELTSLSESARDKELVTLVDELEALLAKVTPEILARLESLTDEQRLMIIGSLAQSPELAKLAESVQPLSESKAAVSLMPLMMSENPAAAADVLPFASKMKVVDIVAYLTKIAIGLGVDKFGLQMAADAQAEEEVLDIEI